MDELDHDVSMLKLWLREAWQQISDPKITAYDRREIRNYMKEAQIALRSGLKQIAERDAARRERDRAAVANMLPEFRILRLEV